MTVKEAKTPNVNELTEQFDYEADYCRAILIDKISESEKTDYYAFFITPDWYTNGTVLKSEFVYFELSSITLCKTSIFEGVLKKKYYTDKEEYAVINAPMKLLWWTYQQDFILPKKACPKYPEALISLKKLDEYVTTIYSEKDMKKLDEKIVEFYNWISTYFKEVRYTQLTRYDKTKLPKEEAKLFVFDPFKTLGARQTKS